jgi:hypothetical protein
VGDEDGTSRRRKRRVSREEKGSFSELRQKGRKWWKGSREEGETEDEVGYEEICRL